MRGHLVTLGFVVLAGAAVVSCQAATPPPSATALATVGPDQPSHIYCRFVAAGSTALPALGPAPSPVSVRLFWVARRAYEASSFRPVFGLRFLELSARDRDRIGRFVSARERAAGGGK